MNIVLAKTGISLLSVFLILIIVCKKEPVLSLLRDKDPRWMLVAGWAVFRLLPFLMIYQLAGFEPTSDVNGFWDEGSKAAMGQVVYRDFWSPYSPLYAYILGFGLKFWFDPKMIVLTMTIMELITLFLSYRFFRPFQSRAEFLFKALVYLLLPGSLVLCVIAAQEDVWMWLFVILAYLIRERTLRVEWYALLLAIGLLATKAIFILILVSLFFLEKEKIRLLWPMILTGIISLAILYPLVGWEFTQPLDEAQTLRAPNIPSVINPWFNNSIGVGEKFWNWIGLLISTGLASLAAFRLKNADFRVMLSRVWVVLYAAMMIVQQSSYSNYIFLFLIPLVFYVIDWKNKWQITLLLLYNVLCVVHPSYWWRLGMPCYLTPGDTFASNALLTDYLMQAGIVVLTVYFIWLSFPTRRVLTKLSQRL